MKQTIISILKILVPIGIGVYLIAYYYGAMSAEDKETMAYAFKHADYKWLLLSIFLGVLSHMSRAYRWKYMLEPMGYKPKFWHLYHGVMIGYIVNLTIPRSGEASRAGFLYKSDKIPFSKGFGTIVAERAVDLIMLGIITLIAGLMQLDKLDLIQKQINNFKDPSTSNQEGSSWLTWLIILVFIGGLLFVLINKKWRDKFIQLIKGVLEGVKAVFKSKNPAGFFLHTVFIWCMYLAMFFIAYKALPATSNMPIAGSLVAFIAGTVGLIFIPGGIGAYPLMVGFITTIYLFPDFYEVVGNKGKVNPEAYAIGWLLWLAQTVLIVSLGLVSLWAGSLITKKQKDVEANS